MSRSHFVRYEDEKGKKKEKNPKVSFDTRKKKKKEKSLKFLDVLKMRMSGVGE